MYVKFQGGSHVIIYMVEASQVQDFVHPSG